MKMIEYDLARVDTEVYEVIPDSVELILKEKARPAITLRAPIVDGKLRLVPERSSIHRKLMAIFGGD